MTKLHSPIFQLTNTHDDYVEFTVSYMLGGNVWLISGIGWLKNAEPNYYLRLLRRNGAPCPESDYEKARLVLKDASYRFKHKALDELARSGVRHAFGQLPKRAVEESGEFGRLQPRRPSKPRAT